MRDDQRIAGLDGIRGIVIILVLIEHYFIPTQSGNIATNALNLLKGHVQAGRLGVDLFFVLSGFLITKLLIDLNVKVKSGEIQAAQLGNFLLSGALSAFSRFILWQ